MKERKKHSLFAPTTTSRIHTLILVVKMALGDITTVIRKLNYSDLCGIHEKAHVSVFFTVVVTNLNVFPLYLCLRYPEYCFSNMEP